MLAASYHGVGPANEVLTLNESEELAGALEGLLREENSPGVDMRRSGSPLHALALTRRDTLPPVKTLISSVAAGVETVRQLMLDAGPAFCM